ncbi:isochorismatase family cysteine hydrolase [Microbacterium sp. 5K110]|jgi:nicotinamidase-related amidase|uniref:cysteine hydrolase family protein n=1 Tax=unclassified Microbacterium TaxID=2609290 RepID=UPI0010FDBA46|nr:isochorismatase family cysteine hydrolase [Microbacterium sp. 5K110]TLF31361.1 cysteine hydrolase [Microbacterium sp. 5K110]
MTAVWEGVERPVLVVVDIQGGAGTEPTAGIPVMDGRAERAPRVRDLIAACRENGVPVVFIQEVHKPSLVDIGRELDGAEGVHCIEGDPGTELAAWLEPRPEEFVIRKRRYSAFFATELELALKSYRADTVLLVGGLTDVCIHYTAVDAHQHDYRVRVLTDCVAGSSRCAHDAALEAIAYLQRDSLITAADVADGLFSRS